MDIEPPHAEHAAHEPPLAGWGETMVPSKIAALLETWQSKPTMQRQRCVFGSTFERDHKIECDTTAPAPMAQSSPSTEP
jgi:hypothetical protein